MGVFTFLCKSSSEAWTAKELNDDLEGFDNSNKNGDKSIGTSSELNLSFADSLYLHPNDTSGSPIVTIKLTKTENYKMWILRLSEIPWVVPTFVVIEGE
ncbi:hypothetical protein Tco_1529390, partial [Tanacetum coccineum]